MSFEIVVCIVGPSVMFGILLSLLWKDSEMQGQVNEQRERAAYWYDKYMMQINPSWEPLSRQAIEELNDE